MITGSLIKKMRNEIGITQQKLADLVGITQAHIAKIENEKVNPRLSTVNKILSVLKTNSTLKCENIITKGLILVNPENPIDHVVKLMKKYDISQMPVVDNGKCVGSISEKTIVRNLDNISNQTKVKELMDESFPIITCNDHLDVIKSLLEYHQAVLISDKGRLMGIVTKSDLLSLLK